jgi:chaperonin GroES
VVAIGPGLRAPDGTLKPVDVQVGDVIAFSQYNGVEVKSEGESYLVLKETDLIGVLEET